MPSIAMIEQSSGMRRPPSCRAFIAAIAAAVAVYAVMIGLTRAVTMEDMALIPHGEKIGRLLRLHTLDETARPRASGSMRRSAARGGAHLKKKDR